MRVVYAVAEQHSSQPANTDKWLIVQFSRNNNVKAVKLFQRKHRVIEQPLEISELLTYVRAKKQSNLSKNQNKTKKPHTIQHESSSMEGNR